ncbi:MAG TPA: helix-turn-helix domain-containing protein [Bacillota bacterium]|nr:helix-turn-helix domain-containing protein [Bacillota bacterium]HOP54534.1 helix-turn-helix domain-containing protein [Bacillota bacterium]HPQ10284.1 helix-turn-helix domain-containing protein [Bacillota bacterium]
MDTLQLMQKCVDYVEKNLTSELSIRELTDLIGFSQYHFCHVFGNTVGMPVAAFITKRRLLAAVYDIQSGARVTDAALAYGFDTHAGFYKAFKREFGCSPTKYLKLNKVRKPRPVNLVTEGKIMLTQTQIRQLLTNWPIDEKLEIGPVYLGNAKPSNEAWTIGTEFVLKTGKNPAGLKTHIAISRALAESGMEAAYPIATRSGEDFITIDDRYYVLTHKIKGSPLTPEERYGGDRFKTGWEYGKAISKLHKILEKYDDSIEVNDNNLLDTVLSWALPETKRIMEQWNLALPDEFYTEYELVFPDLYRRLPRHIIHRDPNPSNIIFADGKVTGSVDFVISERNVRLFDPCYCGTGVLSEAVGIVHDGFEKWPEIFSGIISGYDRNSKLTPAEKQAIPYVIYSIQMISIAWLEAYPQYKDIAVRNRTMLLWLWKNRDLFAEL